MVKHYAQGTRKAKEQEKQDMECPEYNEENDTCSVDGFKFYSGMNKPCDTPGMNREKCPRIAMKG